MVYGLGNARGDEMSYASNDERYRVPAHAAGGMPPAGPRSPSLKGWGARRQHRVPRVGARRR